MKDKERRLKYVEEVLKQFLERNQDTGNSVLLKQLLTDSDFLRGVQDAYKNTIGGRPEGEKVPPQDIHKDPEFRKEVLRLVRDFKGKKRYDN